MLLTHLHDKHVGVRLCNSLGIDFAPVIWSGTSADHSDGGKNAADLDSYPRYIGNFYEMQVTSMKLKSALIFTTIFDEVNEGKL